jgi:hypothetical protein
MVQYFHLIISILPSDFDLMFNRAVAADYGGLWGIMSDYEGFTQSSPAAEVTVQFDTTGKRFMARLKDTKKEKYPIKIIPT